MLTPSDERPDSDKVTAFGNRMMDIINDGALTLLMSIGHRTGLFDVMAESPPITVATLAEAADLSEAPLRAWLDAMARADIVRHDPKHDTYVLPPEHAASLSRTADESLAALAEYVPLIGMMEDRIVQALEKSGHIPYDGQASFRQLISKAANESDAAVIAGFSISIVSLVPGLTEALRAGIDVLDVRSGSGRALSLIAASFPNSRFRGYDVVDRHVDAGMYRRSVLGLANLEFRVQDFAKLDEVDRYDLIMDFDAMRDQSWIERVLGNLARALRPGGTLLVQELSTSQDVDERFGLSPDSALQTACSMRRMADELMLQDGVSTKLLNEEAMTQLLLEAGFDDVVTRRLPHHVLNVFYVATKRRQEGSHGSSLRA
jgi:SAM-dependent methyltransferase